MFSGFWQIKLHPDTADKTAFATHQGVYQYTRLPFGFAGSPAVFAGMMAEVLRFLTFKNTVIYVDDILTYSHTIRTLFTPSAAF